MKPAPIPADDEERVAALQALQLLDSPPSESFDRAVATAARLLHVPVVLVSLVDRHRQWFKAHVGIAATETPRDVSFCGHAVADDRPLAVPDALADPRFADNPLVTGEPKVRAYLGVPLHAPGGAAIGTLCAIDHQPRQFSPGDLDLLKRMARVVEVLIARAGPSVS